jgi:hypothetical protein
MLPNLVVAQLLEVLKQQIENNDAFSIQLKLQTQVNVDVKTTLEKTPGRTHPWVLGTARNHLKEWLNNQK